jgi:hypothetical protein
MLDWYQGITSETSQLLQNQSLLLTLGIAISLFSSLPEMRKCAILNSFPILGYVLFELFDRTVMG